MDKEREGPSALLSLKYFDNNMQSSTTTYIAQLLSWIWMEYKKYGHAGEIVLHSLAWNKEDQRNGFFRTQTIFVGKTFRYEGFTASKSQRAERCDSSV